MKQAIMTAPGEITIHEIEKPQPGPGQVLLQIWRIGVCGSDVHVFHGRHPNTGYSVVQGHEFLECVGVEATMTAAIENIQKGGVIVVVGVFSEKPRVDLGLVQDRELTLKGTLMYQRRDYERAIELIATAKIVTELLFSKHFSLDRYLDAYHFIEAQGDRSMKVFIDVA